jgi:hypothetical protein
VTSFAARVRPGSATGIDCGWASVEFNSGSLAATGDKVPADSVAKVIAEQDQAVQVAPRVIQGHPAQVPLEAAHHGR